MYEFSTWKAACGSHVGRSHLSDGIPCQDCTKIGIENDTLVLALADGAGSADLSHYGAEFVVEYVSLYLADQFDRIYSMVINDPDDATWKKIFLDNLCGDLLIYINEESEAGSQDMEEIHRYASTMLAVAVKNDRFLAMHLGDGLIVSAVKDQDAEADSLRILSDADNGEYANSTVFITSSDSYRYLRAYAGSLCSGELAYTGFILMSDGPASVLYDKYEERVAPACSKILNALKEYDSDRFDEAFSETLKNVLHMQTEDDVSMALAVDAS